MIDVQEPSTAHMYRCTGCKRIFVVVDAKGANAAPRCSCGADLAPDVMPAGAYEVQIRLPSAKKRKRPRRSAAPPRESDLGYSASHGYGVGHGGPTGPGDAPACGTPDTAPCEQDAREIGDDTDAS
jgi:hypothetical protein